MRRRILREHAKDHARLFYVKSVMDTADGSIREKVKWAAARERAWRAAVTCVFHRGRSWVIQRGDLPSRANVLSTMCRRKKARFNEAGLIPLLLDESQGDGLIVSSRRSKSNQQCLLNLCPLQSEDS